MTVKELINELQTLDQDSRVVFVPEFNKWRVNYATNPEIIIENCTLINYYTPSADDDEHNIIVITGAQCGAIK